MPLESSQDDASKMTSQDDARRRHATYATPQDDVTIMPQDHAKITPQDDTTMMPQDDATVTSQDDATRRHATYATPQDDVTMTPQDEVTSLRLLRGFSFCDAGGFVLIDLVDKTKNATSEKSCNTVDHKTTEAQETPWTKSGHKQTTLEMLEEWSSQSAITKDTKTLRNLHAEAVQALRDEIDHREKLQDEMKVQFLQVWRWGKKCAIDLELLKERNEKEHHEKQTETQERLEEIAKLRSQNVKLKNDLEESKTQQKIQSYEVEKEQRLVTSRERETEIEKKLGEKPHSFEKNQKQPEKVTKQPETTIQSNEVENEKQKKLEEKIGELEIILSQLQDQCTWENISKESANKNQEQWNETQCQLNNYLKQLDSLKSETIKVLKIQYAKSITQSTEQVDEIKIEKENLESEAGMSKTEHDEWSEPLEAQPDNHTVNQENVIHEKDELVKELQHEVLQFAARIREEEEESTKIIEEMREKQKELEKKSLHYMNHNENLSAKCHFFEKELKAYIEYLKNPESTSISDQQSYPEHETRVITQSLRMELESLRSSVQNNCFAVAMNEDKNVIFEMEKLSEENQNLLEYLVKKQKNEDALNEENEELLIEIMELKNQNTNLVIEKEDLMQDRDELEKEFVSKDFLAEELFVANDDLRSEQDLMKANFNHAYSQLDDKYCQQRSNFHSTKEDLHETRIAFKDALDQLRSCFLHLGDNQDDVSSDHGHMKDDWEEMQQSMEKLLPLHRDQISKINQELDRHRKSITEKNGNLMNVAPLLVLLLLAVLVSSLYHW